MSSRLDERPNELWIAALEGNADDSESLIADLSGFLHRVLRSTVSRWNPTEDDLTELTQEALTQLVASLPSFRGDSAFPTWAAAVATRVGFTEFRRRTSRDTKHAAFRQAVSDAGESYSVDSVADMGGSRDRVLRELHAAIESELTEKQRIAILAHLRGIPTVEIAEQLDSNPNAVHKLEYDARLRLRDALLRRGVNAELIREIAAAESAG